MLGGMALVLGYANARLLIGVARSTTKESDIRGYLESLPTVERVVELSTRVLGPGRYRLACEIEFHGHQFVDKDKTAKK